MLADWALAPVVHALQALRGMALVTAATVIAELGDITRFAQLREAMAKGSDAVTLDGAVDVDGAHFGGHARPENRKEDRKDRRLAENKSRKRRVVVELAQRTGRVLPYVVRSEADGHEIVQERVALGSAVHADEASHWDILHAVFDTRRINHTEMYSDGGACNNLAESYFSRLRRAVDGQHHHLPPQYLHQYANEAAWREDHCRTNNGAQFR